MKTKLLLLIFLMLVLSGHFNFTSAQIIAYDYDASGNRIVRYINAIITELSVNEDSLAIKTNVNAVSITDSMDIKDDFKVIFYPNPTNGRFAVELPDLQLGEKGSIYIYNMRGNVVQRQKYVNSFQFFDISNLKSGFYILQINIANKVVTKKILKQ